MRASSTISGVSYSRRQVSNSNGSRTRQNASLSRYDLAEIVGSVIEWLIRIQFCNLLQPIRPFKNDLLHRCVKVSEVSAFAGLLPVEFQCSVKVISRAAPRCAPHHHIVPFPRQRAWASQSATLVSAHADLVGGHLDAGMTVHVFASDH